MVPAHLEAPLLIRRLSTVFAGAKATYIRMYIKYRSCQKMKLWSSEHLLAPPVVPGVGKRTRGCFLVTAILRTLFGTNDMVFFFTKKACRRFTAYSISYIEHDSELTNSNKKNGNGYRMTIQKNSTQKAQPPPHPTHTPASRSPSPLPTPPVSALAAPPCWAFSSSTLAFPLPPPSA